MAREVIPVDISETPELIRLVEEVARTGIARLLRRNNQELAVLSALAWRTKPRAARLVSPPRRAADRRATLESTAGSLGPATRTGDFEAMIRDAKEEHAERAMVKLGEQ